MSHTKADTAHRSPPPKPASGTTSPASLSPTSGRTPYGVPFYRLRCPKCKSRRHRVTTSRAPTHDFPYRVRYHTCACGYHFRSFEEIPHDEIRD